MVWFHRIYLVPNCFRSSLRNLLGSDSLLNNKTCVLTHTPKRLGLKGDKLALSFFLFLFFSFLFFSFLFSFFFSFRFFFKKRDLRFGKVLKPAMGVLK